jgi:hypothetical protein
MMGQGLWRECRSCGELIGGMVRVGSKRLLGGEVVRFALVMEPAPPVKPSL